MCSEHLSSTHAIIKKASKFNFEMDKYPKNGVIEMPTNTQNIIDNPDDIISKFMFLSLDNILLY